jgi:hypothetical protein
VIVIDESVLSLIAITVSVLAVFVGWVNVRRSKRFYARTRVSAMECERHSRSIEESRRSIEEKLAQMKKVRDEILRNRLL